mmetsp:Transcript_18514/g.43273  ORF Transcript_18514/g.43273 Transcript_18514/m.43273 type:complete len:360 (+) Transcript_18514:68-1147(+)
MSLDLVLPTSPSHSSNARSPSFHSTAPSASPSSICPTASTSSQSYQYQHRPSPRPSFAHSTEADSTDKVLKMRVPEVQEIKASIQAGIAASKAGFEASPSSGWVLFGYLLSSLLAVIIPSSIWSKERNKYYLYAGQYNEYEQQQRQYEEQQNGNYNNYASSSVCKWWNYRCRIRMQRYQQYAQQNGENGGQNGEGAYMRAMLPDWFFFFGGEIEQDDRAREEMGLGQNEGSTKFVYAWLIVMFVGLTVFAMRSMWVGKDRLGVIVSLLIFGQFSLLNLLTSVQAIETDNRYLEDSTYGWYGQFSVLLAYTDFWIMLHCFLAAAVLGLLRLLDRRASTAEAVQEDIEGYRREEDAVGEHA